ncbi:MAG: D-alanyl-D-alanine carboxypeptidase [Ruminococcaceae bacterium]|nr:D-alanyl-D-alanine carboxypeptidase [Oscillospiraceae bacterium]
MMRYKRMAAALLALVQLAVWLTTAVTAAAPSSGTSGGAPSMDHCVGAYLYNFENDEVLLAEGIDERIFPTSTVKIMTGIVAIEALEDNLQKEIVITEEMLSKSGGNNISLKSGEVVTVEQLLHGMLVNSANDAAIALAYAAYGSVEAFVEKMNEKATRLGAYSTYYANPTGMHNDAMVTTVSDTAIIAKYAYTLPLFMEIVSTPKYVMEATNESDYRNIYNRNCLISKYYNVNYYYSRAIGMNAGSTTQGGYAICAVAEEPATGLTYLAIVMGAESIDGSLYNYINAIKLFEWAFTSFSYVEVLRADKIVCELPVQLSSTLDYVTLVPENAITVYLPSETVVETDIRYSYNTFTDALDAPVETGQEAGTITVLMGDRILGSCALVTTSSVARSEFLYFLARVRSFTEGRFFKAFVISAIVLTIAYVLINAHLRERRLRKRRR